MKTAAAILQNPFVDANAFASPDVAPSDQPRSFAQLAAEVESELRLIVARIERPRGPVITPDQYQMYEDMILSELIGAGELMDLFAANPEFDAWYIVRIMDRLAGKPVSNSEIKK